MVRPMDSKESPALSPPTPPLFVRGDGDLLTFGSAASLLSYVEWPDVKDGVYRAWDATGRPLHLYVADDESPRLLAWSRRPAHRVGIDVDQQARPEQLRNEIVRWLTALGPEHANVAELPLESLLTRAAQLADRP
jgi:hypothetical protein